jgi:TetR/AcrR family transcriptional repressor of nem operon
MINIISEQMPAQSTKAARREAIGALATMMGALLLARMAGTGEFSEEILAAGRQSVLQSGPSATLRTKRAKSAAART